MKNLKSIVIRCTEKGENIQHTISAWQNTSRQDGSLQRSSSSAEDNAPDCLCSPATWRRTTCNKLMLRTKKPRASTIKQKKSYLASDPGKGCGSSIIRQRSVTNRLKLSRADTAAEHRNWWTTMGRPTTEEDAFSDQYSIKRTGEKPQSFGATRRRQKILLTQSWNLQSPPMPPFCPVTSK